MIEYSSPGYVPLALVVAFVCAGIFSGEFSTKADAVFFRRFTEETGPYRQKIKAGCLIITLLYWVCIAAYVLLVLLLAGWGGSTTMIQTDTSGWKSFYNITFLEQALWCFAGGYVGCLGHWRADNGHFRKNKVHNTGCCDPVYSYFFPEIFSSLTVYPFLKRCLLPHPESFFKSMN